MPSEQRDAIIERAESFLSGEGLLYYWIAETDGSWFDAENWAFESGGVGGAGIPGKDDTAVFDRGNARCNFYNGNVGIVEVGSAIFKNTYEGSVYNTSYYGARIQINKYAYFDAMVLLSGAYNGLNFGIGCLVEIDENASGILNVRNRSFLGENTLRILASTATINVTETEFAASSGFIIDGVDGHVLVCNSNGIATPFASVMTLKNRCIVHYKINEWGAAHQVRFTRIEGDGTLILEGTYQSAAAYTTLEGQFDCDEVRLAHVSNRTSNWRFRNAYIKKFTNTSPPNANTKIALTFEDVSLNDWDVSLGTGEFNVTLEDDLEITGDVTTLGSGNRSFTQNAGEVLFTGTQDQEIDWPFPGEIEIRCTKSGWSTITFYGLYANTDGIGDFSLSIGAGSSIGIVDSGLQIGGNLTVESGGTLRTETEFLCDGFAVETGGTVIQSDGSTITTSYVSDELIPRGEVINTGTWYCEDGTATLLCHYSQVPQQNVPIDESIIIEYYGVIPTPTGTLATSVPPGSKLVIGDIVTVSVKDPQYVNAELTRWFENGDPVQTGGFTCDYTRERPGVLEAAFELIGDGGTLPRGPVSFTYTYPDPAIATATIEPENPTLGESVTATVTVVDPEYLAGGQPYGFIPNTGEPERYNATGVFAHKYDTIGEKTAILKLYGANDSIIVSDPIIVNVTEPKPVPELNYFERYEMQLWELLEISKVQAVYRRKNGEEYQIKAVPCQPETDDLGFGESLTAVSDARIFIVSKRDIAFRPKPEDTITALGRTWRVGGRPCSLDHGNYNVMMKILTGAKRE